MFKKTRYISSITGRYVTKKYAKKNPRMTIKLSIKELDKILGNFFDFIKIHEFKDKEMLIKKFLNRIR